MTEERYRGWLIEENWIGWYEATHRDYDGPEDTRAFVDATREGVIEAIDEWILENGDA